MSAEAVDAVVAEAEQRATLAESAAADERREQREQARIPKATVDADVAGVSVGEAAAVEPGAAESGAAVAVVEVGEPSGEAGFVGPAETLAESVPPAES